MAFSTSEYSISICQDCTLGWTCPPPGEVDYAAHDFHAETGATDDRLLPREWQVSLDMQLDLLTRHVPMKSRVLEIGCGTGLLLRRIRDAGYQATGLEVSKSASETARGAGLRIITASFPTPEPLGTFDAVVVSHVVEHVASPVAFLREVVQKTSCRHLLLVQTNHQGLAPRFLGPRWYAWMPEQHYWHFTTASLERLMGQLNFAPLECEYCCLIPFTKTHGVINRITAISSSWRDQFHLILERQT